MCLCLVGTLFEDVSNKFRGENQITEIIFSIWGTFVLYERALLLLFLLHCCWMRVNVSKYQVHQLITIALHIERSQGNTYRNHSFSWKTDFLDFAVFSIPETT